MQTHFKPLCVCHLLKSHWLRQIPWQSPESGLGEVDPLPTGAGTWLCHIIAKPRRIETIILSTMQGESGPESEVERAREVTGTEAEAPGEDELCPCHTADARQSWVPRVLVWFCLSGKTEGRRRGGQQRNKWTQHRRGYPLSLYSLFWNLRAVGTSKMSSWVQPSDARSQEGEDHEDVTLKPLFPSGTQSRHHSLIIALFFPE